MTGPLVLDLYCCAGGAMKGYQRVGLRGFGVDRKPRPNYCGEGFEQADALEFLNAERMWIKRNAVLIHASPPCQAGAAITRGTNAANGWGRSDHVQLVPETREALDSIGLPYVIEQPSGHAGLIRRDLMLCMDMFPIGDPPWVMRHRDFEISGFAVPQPMHSRHRGYVRGMRHGVVREGPYVAAYGAGGGKASIAEMQHALGIDWTSVREELTEAIPPAYTEHIGRAFLSGHRSVDIYR